MVDNNTKERISNMNKANPLSSEYKPENGKTTRVDEGMDSLTVNQINPQTTVNEGKPAATAKVNEFDALKMNTPEQIQQHLDQENEKEGGGKRINADIDKASNEDGKIFEEGDIIDWMFRHIIVAGFNYAGNWTVNTLAYGLAGATEWTLDAVGNIAKEEWKDYKEAWNFAKNGFKQTEDDTKKFSNTVNKLCNDHTEAYSDNIVNDTNRKLIEGVAGYIRRGEFDKLKCFSPATIDALKSRSPQELNAIFNPEKMGDIADNMLNNIATAEKYAANAATARLLEEKIRNKNQPAKDKEAVLFEQYKAEERANYMAYVQTAVERGEDLSQVGTGLANLAEKAKLRSMTIIQKGEYHEQLSKYNANPKVAKNAPFEELVTTIDSIKDSPYKTQSTIDGFASEIVLNKDKMSEIKKDLERREAAMAARAAVRDQRRQKLQKVAANTNNPLIKGLKKMKAQGALRIEDLYKRNPGGYTK